MLREVDPRPARIRAELSQRKTIIVMGSKGGVGKTTVAAMMALALARKGRKPLLVDLDVTDPNMHIVLGLDPESQMPGETKGIAPLAVNGIGFLSIAPYTKGEPAPLRGDEAVNAVRELLAATDYTGYDTVIIDSPPGLGDVTMELLELIPNPVIIVVTTPSKLSADSLRRHLRLLEEMGYNEYIVIYNMARKPLDSPHAIPYDEGVEDAYGSMERLAVTEAFRAVEKIVEELIDKGTI